MPEGYLFGLFLAILAGAMNALGAILQKSAVNRILARPESGRFTAQFSRDPIWLSGLALSMGLGTVCTLGAQGRIGPALVPALTALGMILLAFGSQHLLRERLKSSEWLGILLLVLGVSCLGFARLVIPQQEVDMLDGGTQARLAIFTGGLFVGWAGFWAIARQTNHLLRGLMLAVSAGFFFCLSNLWILPMLVTIGPVFSGTAAFAQVGIFLIACVLLTAVNMLGIQQTQEAYRFAPANKVQPIQSVPTQTVPILIYLFVFQRAITGTAALLVPLGVGLVLAGGFLLSNRRARYQSDAPEREVQRIGTPSA